MDEFFVILPLGFKCFSYTPLGLGVDEVNTDFLCLEKSLQAVD